MSLRNLLLTAGTGLALLLNPVNVTAKEDYSKYSVFAGGGFLVHFRTPTAELSQVPRHLTNYRRDYFVEEGDENGMITNIPLHTPKTWVEFDATAGAGFHTDHVSFILGGNIKYTWGTEEVLWFGASGRRETTSGYYGFHDDEVDPNIVPGFSGKILWKTDKKANYRGPFIEYDYSWPDIYIENGFHSYGNAGTNKRFKLADMTRQTIRVGVDTAYGFFNISYYLGYEFNQGRLTELGKQTDITFSNSIYGGFQFNFGYYGGFDD